MCVYECMCVCVLEGGGRNVWGEIEEGRKSGGGRKGLLLCPSNLSVSVEQLLQ